MMNELIEQLRKHEGERLKPYRCTAGKLTLGVGRNLDDKGITQSESKMLLVNDIDECMTDLQSIFPSWDDFSNNRKIALIDLRFNLGPSRFRSFKRMISAIKKGDWLMASCEALDSKWASQVQRTRVDTITKQLAEG
jgi:lysozyme